ERPERELALGRREVVARADPAQLPAQAGERAPPPAGFVSPGLGRLGHERAVFGGDGRGHPRDELALLCRRREPPDPEARLATGLRDLVGDPLELLPVARVERQRHEPVEELRRTESLELAPDGDPRRRGLARKPVREQRPVELRTRSGNRGYILLEAVAAETAYLRGGLDRLGAVGASLRRLGAAAAEPEQAPERRRAGADARAGVREAVGEVGDRHRGVLLLPARRRVADLGGERDDGLQPCLVVQPRSGASAVPDLADGARVPAALERLARSRELGGDPLCVGGHRSANATRPGRVPGGHGRRQAPPRVPDASGPDGAPATRSPRRWRRRPRPSSPSRRCRAFAGPPGRPPRALRGRAPRLPPRRRARASGPRSRPPRTGWRCLCRRCPAPSRARARTAPGRRSRAP